MLIVFGVQQIVHVEEVRRLSPSEHNSRMTAQFFNLNPNANRCDAAEYVEA
jgi:hypothetical protein